VNTDVLVAGAGPVGLTVAHELARRGVRVRLVDAAAGPATTSRAIATHPRTLETYDQMGVVDDIVAKAVRITAFTLFADGRRLFAGRTPNEVIAGLLHDSQPDLNVFDPLTPFELRSIVSRAIARDPAGRFESARECALALHALETGSAPPASSVSSSSVRRSRARGKSLAVLPFLNAGVDSKLEYLTDGITESIINSLSQLTGVRVVPRSLVFRYKGLQADPATVGLALNARTILTGRVVQQGDVLNIQAELVDVSTESQLWGEQFRQRVSDLVTVQEEIAWQISEALRLKLTGAQKTRLQKRHTASAEASQEYLRGRFEWNSWTAEGFRRAVEHFERAIGYDPKYAPAYAGISDSYAAMAYYGFVPPEVGYPRARQAAEQALVIDPDIADAHASLALSYLLWQFDWAAAESLVDRCLASYDMTTR